MLTVIETMFVRAMLDYSPAAFSEEALKLIYQHYHQNDDSHVEFREMDVEMAFEEESYFDCVENNDIPLEGLEEVSSEFEKVELIKQAISSFLNAKGVLIGFTSAHTVVYENRR